MRGAYQKRLSSRARANDIGRRLLHQDTPHMPLINRRSEQLAECKQTMGGSAMKRMGMVIGIKPERIAEYKKTHAAVWPEVLAKISDCNMRNYTIFLREPENLLFGYFEYHGEDWAADAAKMAADPKTQEWWAIHNPMQTPLASRNEGDWWAMAEEVFHTD
jgi:L-rhamnose mutarotase